MLKNIRASNGQSVMLYTSVQGGNDLCTSHNDVYIALAIIHYGDI